MDYKFVNAFSLMYKLKSPVGRAHNAIHTRAQSHSRKRAHAHTSSHAPLSQTRTHTHIPTAKPKCVVDENYIYQGAKLKTTKVNNLLLVSVKRCCPLLCLGEENEGIRLVAHLAKGELDLKL